MSQLQAANTSVFALRADDSATEIRPTMPAEVANLLAADEDVDAIIAVIMSTGATGDLMAAVQEADIDVPVSAVLLDQPESVRLLPRRAANAESTDAGAGGARPDGAGRLPVYGYPGQRPRLLPAPPVTGRGGHSLRAGSPTSRISGPPPPGRWRAISPAIRRAVARDEGAAAVGIGALRDVLLRVSRLAEDLTEITDLELGLVITRPGAVVAVDARVKVAPQEPHDPFLRRLR